MSQDVVSGQMPKPLRGGDPVGAKIVAKPGFFSLSALKEGGEGKNALTFLSAPVAAIGPPVEISRPPLTSPR
jgi:hypothetical protein